VTEHGLAIDVFRKLFVKPKKKSVIAINLLPDSKTRRSLSGSICKLSELQTKLQLSTGDGCATSKRIY